MDSEDRDAEKQESTMCSFMDVKKREKKREACTKTRVGSPILQLSSNEQRTLHGNSGKSKTIYFQKRHPDEKNIDSSREVISHTSPSSHW